MIAHSLGLTRRKIGARVCTLREISAKERKLFFEDNHIDGDAKAKKAWGLFDKEDTLVACLSVRRASHKKYNDAIEIARFATTLNTGVIGGLSRLCKVAKEFAKEEGAKRLITYLDTRCGNIENSGYEKCGFRKIWKTPPRFWWTDGVHRIDRFKIKADKSLNLTEKQVADQFNVIKIWGCSNLLFELEL
jgi:hypothetical protein